MLIYLIAIQQRGIFVNELDRIKSEMFHENEKLFLDIFDVEWDALVGKLYYNQIQLMIGNRIRPRLVYWGYSAGCCAGNKDQFFVPIKIATAIELIHKSSILLDDYIDDDRIRRGKPTFFVEYGDKKTIIFVLNILGNAIQVINELSANDNITSTDYYNIMQTLANTMKEMSLGVLKELELDESSQFDISTIQDIIDKETSSLLSNSLLFGYYASGHHSAASLEHIELIGRKCGYMFQTMNDLEPLCQAAKNVEYKGHLNTDFASKRKNIAITYLYPQLDSIDKNRLLQAQENHDNKVILNLVKEYGIAKQILTQMHLLHENIISLINEMKHFNASEDWCIGFSGLISRLYYLCLERLGE